ncbi:hypothetical protein RvY_16521 [Ramazzottius varieornatus]|uniref:Uncharacterized protein n=1 Tax=Ramazzottius varieornatus TaxID=947166 RepID=A0A1D1VYS4_RAMVA|nr:hypothetical protein RvY_16521 [Ramazzottius varieornatus]
MILIPPNTPHTLDNDIRRSLDASGLRTFVPDSISTPLLVIMTCHAVFLTGLSVIFLTLTVVGLPVLVGIHVLQDSEHQDQRARKEQLPASSVCHPSLQPSCIPDSCSNFTCHPLSEAVCIPDRCGCEAHFFVWEKKRQVYLNVTEKCIDSAEVSHPEVKKDPKVASNVTSSSRRLVIPKPVQLIRLKRAADTSEDRKPKRPQNSGHTGEGKGKAGGQRKNKQQSPNRKQGNRRPSQARRASRRRSKARRERFRRRGEPHRDRHRRHKGKGGQPPPPDGAVPPKGEAEGASSPPEDDVAVPASKKVNISQPRPAESPDLPVPSAVNVNVPWPKKGGAKKTPGSPTEFSIDTDSNGAVNDSNAGSEERQASDAGKDGDSPQKE